MSNERRRDHGPAERIVETAVPQGDESNQPILPPALIRGIHQALDAGNGRLRMDPQELANRLGALIDREVERLARKRTRHEQKKNVAGKVKTAEGFLGGARGSTSRPASDAARKAMARDMGRQTSETDKPLGRREEEPEPRSDK
jgi:hypothetical protein